MENSFTVNRDNANISYILHDSQMFFEIGYKVLQNQKNNGFIRCYKIFHNGKIKLVYDISSYKSLQSVLSQLNSERFLKVVSRLLAIVTEVRNIGFIQYENIDPGFDNIYIDPVNLDLFLIYLPVNTETNPNNYVIFEKSLKSNILSAISSNQNLNSSAVIKLYTDLKSGRYTLDSLRENLRQDESKAREIPDVSSSQSDLHRTAQPGSIPSHDPSGEKEPPQAKSLGSSNKGMISALGGIFSSKKKKDSGSDSFRPTIALAGVRTPVKVEIVINKPEFILGSNPETVDGVLQFNRAISRVHCRFMYSDGRYFICDLGSSNGTYVNSVLIPQYKQVAVAAGDKIHLADSEFTIVEVNK